MANLYVNSAYNSTTEGWGTTHFSSWSSAYAVSGSKSTSDTITITANSSGISGYIGDSNNKNKMGRNVVIESGSALAIQRRLFKIDKTLTIKAGATFYDKHVNGTLPYTHIDGGKLYVGEKDSTARAVMNFDINCISTLWSAIWESHNADITVGDLGAVGTTRFNDSNIIVKGSVGFGAGTQTALNGGHQLNNSTLTAVGHVIRTADEGKYFAVGYNRISNLTMDNSTIIVDDGVDDTVADEVQLGASSKKLTLKNNSLIQVEKGTAVVVMDTVTMEDSTLEVGTLTINSGKMLSMDTDSVIKFVDIINEGTISITAEAGTHKVLDYTGTEVKDEAFYKAVFGDNWSDNYMVFDNDLYVTDIVDIDKTVIYVNEAWNGSAFCADLGDGKVYAMNSFADINSAAAVAEANSSSKLVIDSDANYTANQWYFLNTKVEEFEAGKWSYDYAVDASKVYDVDVNGKFTAYQHLFNNGTVTVSESGMLRNSECTRVMGGTLILNGNREAGAAALTKDEIFRDVNGNPTSFGNRLYATDAIQLQTAVMQVSCGGTISINNSSVFSGTSGNVWAIIGSNGGGTLSLDNSHIYLCSTGGYGPSISMTNTADGVFALKDSSVIVIQEGVANTINNAGTMTMTGSVVVDAKIVNTGSLTISGESSLTINELVGTAEVTGGTLTDTTITGGAVALTGDVTLAGTNNLTKIWVTGGTTTVAEGATLVTRNPYPGYAVIGGNENIYDGEKAFYAGFDSNAAGKLVVNGTYNAEEFAVSNGGELVVNGTMTANCAYLRAGSTVVNGSLTGSVWGGVYAGATLTINGGTFETRKADGMGVWEVYGDFNVTADSNVKIVNLAGNGTITIDATDVSGNCKVVDVDSSSFSGTINVENLASGMRYEVAADGDIWLLDDSILINAAFGKADAVIPAGYALGVNAFASLEDFSKSESASKGVRTIKYTADKSGALSVNVTSVSGRTDYVIGDVEHYVRAGKTATATLAVTAGETYEFLFTNASADFDLSADSVVEFNSTEPEDLISDVSTEFNNDYAVSEVLGEKKLMFDVTGTADLSFTVMLTNEGRVEYTFLDAQGNQILHGYSSSAFSRLFEELEAGEYTLVVKSLDGENAEFSIKGGVTYKNIDAAQVADDDNTIDAALIATGNTISGWVGDVTGLNGGVSYQDAVDYIDVTNLIQDGRNYFSVTATGSATATLWTRTDGGDWVAKLIWDIHDGTNTRSLKCSTENEYRISIESDNDSSYTMQLS